ncbi:pyridoxal phosphate-dependent decarboxylase family protein [Anaeromyxobacter paludicola]|uniref:Pyridoxal-dependent decarboxylase n=1 Tax=Anaeromyxobacter paludicola TaxID=2918171 RepID=A0ABM7XCD3_9BACT|nr:aminotransferase class V-fold PLP-dependent enzyme [Anaeromyxobacter paludicola]BDG09531.1 pyridoxal-dependent decarboxylase [Anaeromyxobacter paludicola]
MADPFARFEADAHAAVEALARYLRESAEGRGPVLSQPPLRELAAGLEVARWIREGGLSGAPFREFLARYLGATTRLHHPGYFAHQVAVPEPLGAVGSLVDGVTGNAMAIYEMGPAAAAIEFAVLDWMLAKVGFTPAPLPPAPPSPAPHGGGVLTHGGSLANLTALAAARARAAPSAWRDGVGARLAVLAPEAAHYSISRAVGILGLGQGALRAAPCDADGRLVPDRLPAALDALRDEGRAVMAVVASACSTAAGLYDPLREVGALCRERGLWLHVDGAHGASALLSERLRHRLDGIALADSVVWDAHKMLRTPTVCAAVLVRDHRTLDGAFQQDASYLFHEKDEPGFDFLHRTVECTKAALGLRLFLALAAEGEGALARYVERQTALAAEAAALLARTPGFEVAVAPESNIVCFRVAGSDERQLELRRRLLAQGRHYVSSTLFRGRRWLRLALMNPATRLEDVAAMADELRALLGAAEGGAC